MSDQIPIAATIAFEKQRVRIKSLESALKKIITMNRQHAKDQYGDPNKAESWACIKVARKTLAATPNAGS